MSGNKKKRFLMRAVISFVLALVILIAVTGFFLKRGVTVDKVSFGSVTVSKCVLIWKSKLEFQAAMVSFDKGATDQRQEDVVSDTHFLEKGIKAGYYMSGFFSKFRVDQIMVDQQRFTIDLTQQAPHIHELDLSSDNINFNALLDFKKDTLEIEIIELFSSRFNSRLKGHVQVDSLDELVKGKLTLLINDSFPVSLGFSADKEKLTFKGSEAGVITNIAPLVDIFGLSHNIQRWITNYLSGSRYHLKSFSGTLPWATPGAILNTLEAEVSVDDTEYTFAPGLGEAVKGRYTDVFFKKGVLIIKPHDATFYGQDGGESWLDINFNDPANILLTAYIKTRAVANDDILKLLNYYKIKLPFKQVEGKTAVDLQLAINLNKKKLTTEGLFEIDEGVIEHDGRKYNVKDARIKLVNSDVTIDGLEIGYADLFNARVTGVVHAKQKKGALDIALEQMTTRAGEFQLSLDTTSPAHIQYHFAPGGHVIEAKSSSWLLDNLKLQLGAFRAPVVLNELAIDLPLVQLAVSSGILAELSGYVSIKKKQANIHCDLIKYHVKDLQLMSPHIAIDIDYDEGIVIRNEEISQWKLSNMPVTLYPCVFRYTDDIIFIEKSRISYGEFFDSYLAGYYNRLKKQGKFTLEQIDVTNKNLQKKLELDEKANVTVSGFKGKFVINFPEYDLRITTDEEKNWSAHFGDLSKVYSRSRMLQKSGIREGSLILSSANGKRPYKFSADIKAPVQLLVEKDTLVDQLHITGQLTDDGTFASVNNVIDITYANSNLGIESRNIGFNISAIIQLLQNRPKLASTNNKEQKDKKAVSITLHADKSHLYLGRKSRILADTINLEFLHGKLSLKLNHGPGQIVLQLVNGTFMLDGHDLNDEFMGALIQSSSFQGGRMSIDSFGSLDDFGVVFTVEDTVLLDLATVNNLMAFLNTAPALMTFSLPEYDTRGLPITSAIAGLKFKDKIATFESIEVQAPELSGTGKGWIDFSKKMIDMDIYLKTQAARNVGKVPVVGYVLAGKEEDASLTLKIAGNVNDPGVENSLLKEIFTYPLEILYRTLNLPLNLLEKLGEMTTGD